MYTACGVNHGEGNSCFSLSANGRSFIEDLRQRWCHIDVAGEVKTMEGESEKEGKKDERNWLRKTNLKSGPRV